MLNEIPCLLPEHLTTCMDVDTGWGTIALCVMRKLGRYGEVKPWEKMRVSRNDYMRMRPWKDCGMARERFEQVVVGLPDEVFGIIHEDVQAELLTQALFKLDRID